jgi:diguanylate cyclase (GGDEF)-like protein/PAS domain S-box-containing protein
MIRDMFWLASDLGWWLAANIGIFGVLTGVIAARLIDRARAARAIRRANASQQLLIADTEDKLRAQNICLDTALNNMSQGLCMFDASARIVLVNRRFLEMYRLSPAVVKPGCPLLELVKHRTASGLLDADPEQFARRILDDAMRGQRASHVIPSTDGREFEVVVQPMPGGGWVTTHDDITERRQTEQRVRDQRLQLDNALNNMSQGLVMYDAQARLVLCNRRYLEIYDLSPEITKPGCSLLDLLHARKAKGTFAYDPEDYVRELRAALAAGKAATLTNELPDGRVISIANHPMPEGGWVTTHEDITERRRAEEDLQDKKLQLDAALNNMSQGLVLFDAEARVILCNQRYREIYDLSPEEVKAGSRMQDLLGLRKAKGTFPLDPDEYVAQLQAELAHGKPVALTAEYPDGRVISIANHPMSDGRWVTTYEDITQRRRAETERDRSQAFANTVIENVPVPIVVKDALDLRYALINRAAEEYYCISRAEMIGKTSADVFAADTAALIKEHDAYMLRTGNPLFLDEHPFDRPNGDTRIVTTSRMPIRDQNGEIKHLLTVIEDRTQRKRAEAQIAHMAHHDLLTGLPNRAAFNSALDSTIDAARRDKASFALLCLNLDRFKQINDVFGHVAGDALLCEIACRLQEAMNGAFLARFGSDEFTVIAVDGRQPAAAEALADRIIRSVGEDFDIDGEQLRAGISIGIAIYPADGQNAAALITNADAALDRAKAQGGGTFRFFEAGMDERLRDRRALQQSLQTAIQRNELLLHYQPQALIGGEVIGFEALVRWKHPSRGIVRPGTFIPIAEESGLIISIGEWIMREACRQAAAWPNPLQIAINLSPVQFRHGDLPGLVHSVLLETGLPPSRLELEITEGVLIDDFSRAVSILRRLKSLGVRIAMDDFGTGYSSLSYLQSFPFDKIKIDQTFISNLERSPQSATIIRAVLGLARGLALPVLAEGVETKDQLNFLAQESCEQVQGMLIGAPMPIEDYAELTKVQGGPPTPSITAAAS